MNIYDSYWRRKFVWSLWISSSFMKSWREANKASSQVSEYAECESEVESNLPPFTLLQVSTLVHAFIDLATSMNRHEIPSNTKIRIWYRQGRCFITSRSLRIRKICKHVKYQNRRFDKHSFWGKQQTGILFIFGLEFCSVNRIAVNYWSWATEKYFSVTMNYLRCRNEWSR